VKKKEVNPKAKVVIGGREYFIADDQSEEGFNAVLPICDDGLDEIPGVDDPDDGFYD